MSVIGWVAFTVVSVLGMVGWGLAILSMYQLGKTNRAFEKLLFEKITGKFYARENLTTWVTAHEIRAGVRQALDDHLPVGIMNDDTIAAVDDLVETLTRKENS